MITKESLESKLEGLKAQLEQLKVNGNAVAGAIQMMEQLIAEEKAAEEKSKAIETPKVEAPKPPKKVKES
jgi:septal ring factor EnvC (AmiA/AmiB activator)